MQCKRLIEKGSAVDQTRYLLCIYKCLIINQKFVSRHWILNIKIPSEIEVAPRYKLLVHCFSLFTLFILFTLVALFTMLTLLSLLSSLTLLTLFKQLKTGRVSGM